MLVSDLMALSKLLPIGTLLDGCLQSCTTDSIRELGGARGQRHASDCWMMHEMETEEGRRLAGRGRW